MNNTKPIIIVIIVLILAGVGAFAWFQNSDKAKEEGVIMVQDEMRVEATQGNGSYETYSAEKLALANEGKVVLFFRASWCPSCKALDEDIRSRLDLIPTGVTILDVDYDKSAELKRKYGVTYQHTFVQVDASGNQITKWAGSSTLADLVQKIK